MKALNALIILHSLFATYTAYAGHPSQKVNFQQFKDNIVHPESVQSPVLVH